MANLNDTKLKTATGATIDSATADVLAAEAELRLRPFQGENAPSRSRPAGTSPRVTFRATPELYQAAKRRASKEGRTISDLAREAVNRYLDS